MPRLPSRDRCWHVAACALLLPALVVLTLLGVGQLSVRVTTPCGRTPPRPRYHSGSIEREWLSSRKTGHICTTATVQVAQVRAWLQYSRRLWSAENARVPLRATVASTTDLDAQLYRPLRPPTETEPGPEERVVLSHFTVGGAVEYIEPLSGMARHPLSKLLCPREARVWEAAAKRMGTEHLVSTGLYDVTYLVLANACGADGFPSSPRCEPVAPAAPPPRNRLYDLGCSVYKGAKPVTLSSGFGLGPSIPLMYQLYEKRCLAFDDIYGWEANSRLGGESWWRRVPLRMREKIRFYNMPVDESTFLRFLNATAQPDDFVVLKVDVDGGPELEIVRAVAERPELARLVDEIFFEHHFWFDGKDFGWGKNVTRGNNTVDESLALMRLLRERGVRSHYWI